MFRSRKCFTVIEEIFDRETSRTKMSNVQLYNETGLSVAERSRDVSFWTDWTWSLQSVPMCQHESS